MSDSAIDIAAHSTLDTSHQALAMIPKSLESCWQLAEWLSKAGLFVKRRDPLSVADIFAIVLAGVEIGLPPMASLRGIYIVNGKTAMESKTKMAVCLQRGVALYFRRTLHTPDTTTWVMKRRGSTEEASQTYTRGEAKAAGLLDKEGPWRGYTQRMISHRALGWICDDNCADVLMGIATAEDDERPDAPVFQSLGMVGPGVELGAAPVKAKSVESIQTPQAAQTATVPPAAAKPATETAPPPATEPAPKVESAPPPAAPKPTGKPVLDEAGFAVLKDTLRECKTDDDIKGVSLKVTSFDMPKAWRDELSEIRAQQKILIRDAAKAEPDASNQATLPMGGDK